ncbi:MAG TPA: hypothetical protein VIJ62_08155 [Rhizomicrobium sp.]
MANAWHDEHRVLSPKEATQGVKLGHMRYVLGFSLALAFGAGILMLLWFVG